MMSKQRILGLLVSFLFLSEVQAAIQIDDYSDEVNDRFTDSADFLLNGFDLSGIGRTDSGQWATAVSRNVFMSAAHARPTGVVNFYVGNDITARVSRTIVSGQKITTADGSTDLYIGVLDAPLPSTIVHYQLASLQLSGTPTLDDENRPVDDAGILQNHEVLMFGRSPKAGASSQDMAVGRNRITGYSENTTFLGNTNNDSLIFEKNSFGDTEYLDFEARFAGGDSGGPTFRIVGGELELLGTNAFNYGASDFVTGGIGSGINYLGNERDFIDSYIAFNAVPEPSSIVLLLVAALPASFFRRRVSKEQKCY